MHRRRVLRLSPLFEAPAPAAGQLGRPPEPTARLQPVRSTAGVRAGAYRPGRFDCGSLPTGSDSDPPAVRSPPKKMLPPPPRLGFLDDRVSAPLCPHTLHDGRGAFLWRAHWQ